MEALEHGASFEPDQHLATLVLRHVGSVRDRLALECCSRVWRAVGHIPGVWLQQNLTLSGDLAARLTDARVRHVLRRAGPNLRSLTVNDAPAAFTGDGLFAYAARVDVARGRGGVVVAGLPAPDDDPAFGRLQTLDLSRCPGVTGRALHSSASQLNVSAFCRICWVHSVCMLVIARHRLGTQRLSVQMA
jgi:hypothetical protein